MAFNVCICVDLILMIKHPFASKSKRIARYYIFTFIVGFIAVVENSRRYDILVSDQSFLTYSQVIIFLTFCIMGIFSSLFALNRLCKPGVSREVRILILKRHISYILAFFACNLYLLIQAI